MAINDISATLKAFNANMGKELVPEGFHEVTFVSLNIPPNQTDNFAIFVEVANPEDGKSYADVRISVSYAYRLENLLAQLGIKPELTSSTLTEANKKSGTIVKTNVIYKENANDPKRPFVNLDFLTSPKAIAVAK